MKIFLASDHGGFELKNALYEHLFHLGYDVEDLGPHTLNPKDDYPQFAYQVTAAVLGSEDKDPRGILVCKSGQGMAIAANRVRGIRAAVVCNETEAKETREDNDSNVLSISAMHLDHETAFKITETWLKTRFSAAPRHIRRIKEIEELYG